MKGILQSIRKRPLNIILIFIGAMLYLINNLFLKENLPRTISWFFTGYFNDLICPLIFFSYANMLLLTTGRELQRLFFLLAAAAGAGFVWEFAAPLWKDGSVTDPADMLCYFAGSIVYWFLLQCCLRKGQEK